MEKEIDEVVGKQMVVINYINGKVGNDIDGYLQKTDNTDLPGEVVSRAIMVLSTNNVFLGLHVSKMDYEINMMEAIRKNSWTDEYAKARSGAKGSPENPVKVTQKDSEMIADRTVQTMIMDEIEAKRSLAKIKNLRTDCKELVTSLQSRLNHLKQERIDASMVPNPR